MMYDKKYLRKLKNNYLTAKALTETIKEQAEEIAQNILDANEFYYADEWVEENGRTRIKRPFDSYLMNDADFERYAKMCYAEQKKRGIANGNGWEWTPEAEADEMRRESEQMLVNFALDILPETNAREREILREHSNDIKFRKQILDGILRLEA